MYEVKCMYPDAMIQTLGRRKTAAQAKEFMETFKKQRAIYNGKFATEYWYQKEGTDTPEYINRITEWILDQNTRG
jgi:hypothetical protein